MQEKTEVKRLGKGEREQVEKEILEVIEREYGTIYDNSYNGWNRLAVVIRPSDRRCGFYAESRTQRAATVCGRDI